MAVLVAIGFGVMAAVSVPAIGLAGYQDPSYPQPGNGLPAGCVMLCDSPALGPGQVWPDYPILHGGNPGWSMPLDQGPNQAPFNVTADP
ncbi:hypothetical protein AB0N05_13275 [Nocardia sp. NPDC051030]|uniref:hypothetical protein n=1 Tax=Nocardia sp. NPDC051030 TaxID=3155162 RepID=UPI0034261E1B